MISKYELFSTSVSCLYRDILRIERNEMAKFGRKGPHAQCLLAMSRYPEGVTASRLCEICEKDKAAVSRTVAELEELGLLVRSECNGVRYRALLTLTDRGYRVARAVNEKASQAVAQAGMGLNDAQREVFYSVLAHIADNLHAICRNGLETTD